MYEDKTGNEWRRGELVVGNEKPTLFWKDTGLDDSPLGVQCLNLYNIVQGKNVYVALVLGVIPLNIQFRRTLDGINGRMDLFGSEVDVGQPI